MVNIIHCFTFKGHFSFEINLIIQYHLLEIDIHTKLKFSSTDLKIVTFYMSLYLLVQLFVHGFVSRYMDDVVYKEPPILDCTADHYLARIEQSV